MHLRSLTLKGFKSFADKTTLAFEPGLTVVVGPNGSGKSNVTDAVLWVLGEQSAKSLRGQAMEDVIFAGSSARQPVGVAEVALVLDNTDGSLPLDFDEVSISRRMYRSGESEYFLNSGPCRLMDIHELLHDTGLGRETSSIISQGRLEEVLNSRPDERRALIEEAAGVLKHKRRRDRALRKLTALDTHIERVRDVITEVDRQLKPLKRQADRAMRHGEIVTRLEQLEVALAVDELKLLQEGWATIEKQEREFDAETELLRYRLAEREAELEKFQSLLEEKGLFVGDLSEQRRRLQSILERVNSGLLLLEEKGKNLVEKLSDLRQKLHQAQSRSALRTVELERLTAERAETSARLKARHTELGELRRSSEAARKGRMAADEDVASVIAALTRAHKDYESARTELAALEQRVAAVSLEADLLGERLEERVRERAERLDALARQRSRYERLESEVAALRRHRAVADVDVDKSVRVLESRRKDAAAVRDALNAAVAEIRALEEVGHAFRSASPALAWALMNSAELAGFRGPLTDRFSVDDEAYERVVEHLLGGDLFAILVDDVESAARVAGSASQSSDGDLSLIAVDHARPRDQADLPRRGTLLVDHITCDDEVRDALESLLGDIVVVPTLADALHASMEDIHSRRWATLDGCVVWPSGKITLGRVVSTDGAGVLARKRRLLDLERERDRLDIAVGECEAEVSIAEEALAVAQQDALELDQRIAQTSGELESARSEVAAVEAGVTSSESEIASLKARSAEITDRAAREALALDGAKAQVALTADAIASLEERSAAAHEVREQRLRDERAVSELLATCQVEIAATSEREVYLKRHVSSISAELSELEEVLIQSQTTEASLDTLRERIQPVHELYMALLERAEYWAHKLRDRARLEHADSESLRSTIQSAQESVRTLRSSIDERSESIAGIRVEKGRLELQVNAAVTRIVDGHGTSLESAFSCPPIDDREAAANTVRRLRKDLEDLGPVNPMAAAELEMLDARRVSLAGHLDDLVASKHALKKVAAAIDRKVRERFFDTFQRVDEHFQQTFAVLFPGGQASLSLTDPDDPERTGVEVVAQPRGKKLSKMSLMSGGEKSLTALALLFAVYRTRPCPFYILDEVEAALDDINLRRFIAFINSMRLQTQLILVTHQRRTMESADVLYGVSMQADGVSKVVSHKLSDVIEARGDSSEPALV